MLELKNDTQTIRFDKVNYVLTSIDYGTVGATHSRAKGVGQIGERVINTALETRDIEIVGFIRASSKENMKFKKNALYQVCNPQISFQALQDDVALTCRATETVRFPPNRLTNNDTIARFVIRAFCPDPLFADAAARYRKIAEWVSNFAWPLSIPKAGFTFANRSISLIAGLENNGDVETGLLIHFAASSTVINPVLTDADTGEFIRFNKIFMPGETVVVNTNYGQESVISYTADTTDDVINDLDLSSTFLQARPGITRLHFTADGNTNSMTVTIYYHQKYLGV